MALYENDYAIQKKASGAHTVPKTCFCARARSGLGSFSGEFFNPVDSPAQDLNFGLIPLSPGLCFFFFEFKNLLLEITDRVHFFAGLRLFLLLRSLVLDALGKLEHNNKTPTDQIRREEHFNITFYLVQRELFWNFSRKTSITVIMKKVKS